MSAYEPESKELSILRILQILEKYSNAEHRLTQEEIIDRLSHDYGITMERKAVSRKLSYLKEAGYEIDSDHRGSCLKKRRFSDYELQLLIDSVNANTSVSGRDTKELIGKLSELSDSWFDPIHAVTTGKHTKSTNEKFFSDLQILHRAISLRRVIRFTVNTRDENGRTVPSWEAEATPVTLYLHDQVYFLLTVRKLKGEDGGPDRHIVRSYPAELLSDIKITREKALNLSEVEEFRNGIDLPKLIAAYAAGDSGINAVDPATGPVSFLCPDMLIPKVLRIFGNAAAIRRIPDPEPAGAVSLALGCPRFPVRWVKVSVNVSNASVRQFVFEHAPYVAVLAPENLRRSIENTARGMISLQKCVPFFTVDTRQDSWNSGNGIRKGDRRK